MKFLRDRRTGQRIAHANLSLFHPDYGLTPAEHEANKAKRAAGKMAFDPIAKRRKEGRMTSAAKAMRS